MPVPGISALRGTVPMPGDHFRLCLKFLVLYLFSAFKESMGQALRDRLEHQFVLKMTHFWDKKVSRGQVLQHIFLINCCNP